MTDFSLDRGLPASQDAEKAILGAVILESELWYEVSSTLKAEHFYLDAHRRIFAGIASAMGKGKPVDTLTLAEELSGSKELEAVGGVAYLSSLTDGVPKRSSVAHYIEIVKDKAKLRSIIHACNGGMSQAIDASDKPDEIAASIADCMLDICGEEDGGIVQVGSGTDDTWKDFESRKTLVNSRVGYSLGVDAVDELTGGICKSEIFVVAARPSVGKTGFAGQLLHRNASQEIPCGIFSLEMTRAQIQPRLWAIESGVEYWKIQKPRMMSNDEERRVRHAAIKIQTYPLYIDDSSHLDIAKLVARAVLMVKRFKVEIVVVDYLGKIDAPGKSEYEQVTKAIRSLTQFAKDYCPVVCLSQLARPTEHNIAKRPNYLELRSSGQIEADAHSVLLLHREVDDQEKYTEVADIIVAKNRRGEQGTIPSRFNKNMVCFEAANVQ